MDEEAAHEAREQGHPSFLAGAGKSNALRLDGLMTMAPYDPDPEASRPTFKGLRWLRDRIQEERDSTTPLGLSMGMTGDFEVAIQEGATIVRVGTAIFGPRQPR